MADKSLETDDSLSDMPPYKTNISPQNSINSQKTKAPIEANAAKRLNIIEEKISADAALKTCPMCGKIFDETISFSKFQQHVEVHFIDNCDLDSSIERNFEYISTVGDF